MYKISTLRNPNADVSPKRLHVSSSSLLRGVRVHRHGTTSAVPPQTMSYEHPVYTAIRRYRFILCSSSPRRRDILRQIGFEPIVRKSNFKEDLDKASYDASRLVDYVADTAYHKLLDVRNALGHETASPLLLLSADTVIICNGEIFEKPRSYEGNVAMLQRLRAAQAAGHKINIVTCGVLVKLGDGVVEQESRFRTQTAIHLVDGLTDAAICSYCRSGEGLEVAGGFKIQGLGAVLFDAIDGDFYNCVGLPASRVFAEICSLVLE